MTDPDLFDLLDAIATGDLARRVQRCGALIRYAIASELVYRDDDLELHLTVYGAEVHACAH